MWFAGRKASTQLFLMAAELRILRLACGWTASSMCRWTASLVCVSTLKQNNHAKRDLQNLNVLQHDNKMVHGVMGERKKMASSQLKRVKKLGPSDVMCATLESGGCFPSVSVHVYHFSVWTF